MARTEDAEGTESRATVRTFCSVGSVGSVRNFCGLGGVADAEGTTNGTKLTNGSNLKLGT